MRGSVILGVVFALSLLAVVTTASADVYGYKDKDGIFTFTRVPCSEEQREQGCSRILRERQWKWVWDSNYDGKVTIRDVSGWVKWLFYYPGDFLVYGMLNDKGSRRMGEFFEITPESYGGWGSFAISLFAWWTLLYSIATFPDELMKDGRKLTSQLKKWRNWYRLRFKRSLN